MTRLRPVALVLAVLAALVAPAAAPAAPPEVSAPSAIVVDARTGDVLYAKAPDQRRPIASTTKLMTALVALEEGDRDAIVKAPRYRGLDVESQLGLEPGERISLADLLRALLAYSANDAANAIATHVSGSVPAFVRRMNRRAQELGLDRTSYENPIGLDATGNFSTARDLATLTRELRTHRFFRRTVDAETVRLKTGARSRTLTNRNTLLTRADWVNGVKTGYTSQAGDVLVASGRKRGIPLVSAVLGEPSKGARDDDSLALLEYGFSRYKRMRAVTRGQVLARVPIAHRAGAELPVMAASTVRKVLRRGERFELREKLPEEIEGPVSYGDEVGTLEVVVRDETVATVPLTAGLNIPAAGAGRRAQSALTSPWVLVALAGVFAALAVGARGRRSPPAREPRPRRAAPPPPPAEEAGQA